MSVILTLTAAFALRGTISNNKLVRIVADLQPVVSYAADALNLSDISLTWATFGQFVDDATMPGIMRRWLSHIPAGAIRMRVVLSQAAGSGMTSLDVIARAVHEHPEFPWPLIEQMYPQEWDAAHRAILLVGENPYYGYRRDLSGVRSTLFKYFAGFCGKLLIAAGDKSLDGYRGFAEDKINKDSITRMIDAYMSKQSGVDFDSPPTPEAHAKYRKLRDSVARHPANLQTLARMGGHGDVPDDQITLAREADADYVHLLDRIREMDMGADGPAQRQVGQNGRDDADPPVRDANDHDGDE